MNAADRLEAALLDAAEALLEVVGLPDNPADIHGPRFPCSGSLVDRDAVPDGPYRAACAALQYVLVGYEFMDPNATIAGDVDAELAAITRRRA